MARRCVRRPEVVGKAEIDQPNIARWASAKRKVSLPPVPRETVRKWFNPGGVEGPLGSDLRAAASRKQRRQRGKLSSNDLCGEYVFAGQDLSKIERWQEEDIFVDA